MVLQLCYAPKEDGSGFSHASSKEDRTFLEGSPIRMKESDRSIDKLCSTQAMPLQ